jgi:hypothetical protein
MIKNEKRVLNLYKKFSSGKDSRWTFGNSILYKMCKDNPKHTDPDVIVGKIWLIGRSYAAAIERRKDANQETDNFYFDIVAPNMKRIGIKLDKKISTLSKSSSSDIENLLTTHKFLTDEFNKISHLQKRSLASKYLHFHCPKKVFIYDSRANNAINKLVVRPYKSVLNNLSPLEYDKEYGKFVCKVLELKHFLETELKKRLSPRDIDNFLLSEII